MKKNSKLISKKCLRPNSVFAVALSLSIPISAFAIPLPTKTIEVRLRADLETQLRGKKSSFEALLKEWNSKYGRAALPALKKISHDTKLKDQNRYISMMATIRLGGESEIQNLLPLSKDKSWMVRSGVLKAVELTHSPQGKSVSEMLLQDPALVIRTQAVETLIDLNPPDLKDLLVKAAFDPLNYRGGDYKKGRAEWVPERALAGLRKIQASGISRQLVPLMLGAKDAKLRAHALYTIESLEGKKLKPKAPFQERAQAWANVLVPKKI